LIKLSFIAYGKVEVNIAGKRIREARHSHNPRVTQTQLATMLQLEGLNLDQVQISKIERQSRPITDKELAVVARLLGVSSSWLL
jgi:hypothetical protein